jgi:hypothetical protein
VRHSPENRLRGSKIISVQVLKLVLKMYFSGYLIRNSTKKDNNDSNSVIYYVAPTA